MGRRRSSFGSSRRRSSRNTTSRAQPRTRNNTKPTSKSGGFMSNMMGTMF